MKNPVWHLLVAIDENVIWNLYKFSKPVLRILGIELFVLSEGKTHEDA